jgi:hypothetical protein
LYNVTLAQVISYYDYGSAQVVAAGETFVVDLDQAAGVYTAS